MGGVLEGRVAVVTGGGTGLGEAIVRRFAREGCRVVVSGRRAEPIERAAAEAGGLAVPADVAEEEQAAALFKTCEDAYGRLDILVNNAGWGGGGVQKAEEIDIEAWDRTFAVNVRGVILCIKHAVPMLKRRGGSIVNVASNAGIRPNPRQTAYGASKAAVMSITQAVAQELGGDGIRVNAICPGAVDTDLYRGNARARTETLGKTIEDDMARIASNAALGRLASREDISEAALYLASDASGAMTGEYLRIDGGKP